MAGLKIRLADGDLVIIHTTYVINQMLVGGQRPAMEGGQTGGDDGGWCCAAQREWDPRALWPLAGQGRSPCLKILSLIFANLLKSGVPHWIRTSDPQLKIIENSVYFQRLLLSFSRMALSIAGMR
ncbi:protein of unknown function [Rhodovastum atsumiense]|nr:protein of unknown function [Rhodovastum atsumiense]